MFPILLRRDFIIYGIWIWIWIWGCITEKEERVANGTTRISGSMLVGEKFTDNPEIIVDFYADLRIFLSN